MAGIELLARRTRMLSSSLTSSRASSSTGGEWNPSLNLIMRIVLNINECVCVRWLYRSSVVYGFFLAIGAIFFALVRAYNPRLQLFSVFGTIVLDVFCVRPRPSSLSLTS